MARIMPGSAGGGQAAAAPNPQQPQLKLKAIPMIRRMEEAKAQLRKPQVRPRQMVGGPMVSGGNDQYRDAMWRSDRDGAASGPMPPSGSGREPGMGAPPGLKFMAPPPGAEPGGPMVEQPGLDQKIAGLPPHIQKAIATQGLDTVMANRAGLAGRLGLPPQAPPAANPGMPGGGMDAPVSGMPGPGGIQAKPMPTGLPPGAEPGGPGGMQPGSPGQARPFDVSSIQDLYQQLMPGRRPPQYGGGGGMGGFGGFGGSGGGGGMSGGGLPSWLAASAAYR